MIRRGARGGDRLATFLASVSLVDAMVVALAQTGLVSRLPEPPGDMFDSMRVVRSRVAYPLGVPDTLLAIANHAANLVLLRARRAPSGRARAATALLLASVGAGAVGAIFYAYQMAFRVRKVCPYCVVAIASNLALAATVVRTVAVTGDEVTAASTRRPRDDRRAPRAGTQGR